MNRKEYIMMTEKERRDLVNLLYENNNKKMRKCEFSEFKEKFPIDLLTEGGNIFGIEKIIREELQMNCIFEVYNKRWYKYTIIFGDIQKIFTIMMGIYKTIYPTIDNSTFDIIVSQFCALYNKKINPMRKEEYFTNTAWIKLDHINTLLRRMGVKYRFNVINWNPSNLKLCIEERASK